MFSNPRVHWVKMSIAMLLCFVAPIAMAAEGVSNTEAMATLPLEKVLEMQKMIDAASEEVEVEPPVAATVNRIELSGRLLEGAIEFNAHYDIEVLSNGSWVEVPLLEQDAQTHLLKLPKVADASFAVIDGNLHFISKKRKRYQFDLSILKEASIEGKNRSLRIQLADSSVSICKLTFDEDLFELSNTRVLAKPDGVLVFPTDGAFSIGWVVAEGAVVSEEREKPEIASVIPAAYASSVSTLEGMRITRLLYQLRFAGRKTIEFEIPEHQKVERAFLNGFAVPVEMVGRQLQIEAAPARAGDESATIELVLTKSEGVFHLAGNIALSLPKTSWPMNEIFLDLHLPDVFNYQWKGGSLSPVKSRAMPAFTYRVPLPGKKMSFHQYLVTTHAPQVGLEYAVDLKDQYFCAGETSRTARVQSVEVPVRSSREVY